MPLGEIATQRVLRKGGWLACQRRVVRAQDAEAASSSGPYTRLAPRLDPGPSPSQPTKNAPESQKGFCRYCGKRSNQRSRN